VIYLLVSSPHQPFSPLTAVFSLVTHRFLQKLINDLLLGKHRENTLWVSFSLLKTYFPPQVSSQFHAVLSFPQCIITGHIHSHILAFQAEGGIHILSFSFIHYCFTLEMKTDVAFANMIFQPEIVNIIVFYLIIGVKKLF